MVIDEQTIRSLLADQHIIEGMTRQNGTTIGLDLFIERLTTGINENLSTAQQVDSVKEELDGLKEKYEENCAELDMELGRLVKACKHPSYISSKVDGLVAPVVICNICGGLIEDEINDIF